MKQLNLPSYSFRIARKGKTELIWDSQRKRWVRLTPEEWVRQHFVQYLIHEGGYPPGLIGVEINLIYNNLTRRTDIVVYNRKGNPVMIVECKSYEVEIIDNDIFDQINNYNRKFGVSYFVVTNGNVNLSFSVNPETHKPEYMNYIPLYSDLIK